MKINTFEFKGITIESEFPNSDVPCGSCSDCCKKLTPYLTKEEFMSGKYAYTFMDNGNSSEPAITIPKGIHGGCMYFVDNACSIYDNRPKSCKQFDCRFPETGHPKIPNKFSNIKYFDLFNVNFKLKCHDEQEKTKDNLNDINWVKEKLVLLFEFLNSGDFYIDVGANIGLTAIFAAKVVGPTGKVYAFEPDDKNYFLLCENIKLNNLENIIIPIKKAVVDSDREVSIMNCINNFENHFVKYDSIGEIMAKHYFGGSVSSVKLSEFISNLYVNEFKKISVIKLTTLGFDVKVINDLERLLDKNKFTFIMDYNPEYFSIQKNSVFDVFSFIDRNRYIPISTNNPSPMNILNFIELTNRCLVNKNSERIALKYNGE